MKQLFTNANILTPGTEIPQNASLITDGGQISAVGNDLGSGAEKSIDCNGQILAPGIVDLGVFAIDKPAFRFGGITRVGLMPDQSPVLDLPAMIKHRAAEGKPDLWSHPMAAATKGLTGKEIAEIALMKESGTKAVATGRSWIADSGLMMKLLQYCKTLELPLIVHSEDGGLTAGTVATNGETATRLGLTSAPSAAEALSIARDIALVRETGAHVHFRQITTAAGLELIRRAKNDQLPVSCGITPAHFLLSDIAIADFRTFARLSPPLRDEEDRIACIEAIKDGTIDVICSGHDPRGAEDKRLPFAEANPGMAGAETLLALSLNLVREKTVSLGRLFELLSTNPAKLLDIEAGSIAKGYEADFILLDTEKPWQINAHQMKASAGNTPFDGLPVQGMVTLMYKGGRAI